MMSDEDVRHLSIVTVYSFRTVKICSGYISDIKILDSILFLCQRYNYDPIERSSYFGSIRGK